MHSSLPSGPPFKLRSSLITEDRPHCSPINQLANQPSLLPSQAFYFTQRTGKLDVRRISRLNLEQIIEDVDIEALQQHLESIAFSSLNEDTISQVCVGVCPLNNISSWFTFLHPVALLFPC